MLIIAHKSHRKSCVDSQMKIFLCIFGSDHHILIKHCKYISVDCGVNKCFTDSPRSFLSPIFNQRSSANCKLQIHRWIETLLDFYQIFYTVIGNSTGREGKERKREREKKKRRRDFTHVPLHEYTPGAPTPMPVRPSVVSWGGAMNRHHHNM